MNTDNFKTNGCAPVPRIDGMGDAQRREYDGHVPIVLVQLSLASLRNRRGFLVSVRRS
jgi:hypothetical protein